MHTLTKNHLASPETRRAYRQNNKGKIKAWAAGSYRKDPERFAAHRRKQSLKILMKIATRPRPNACECCGGPPTTRYKVIALDHDHQTGKFRGWLCHKCNTAIGLLGDNFEGVMRALTYLAKAAS